MEKAFPDTDRCSFPSRVLQYSNDRYRHINYTIFIIHCQKKRIWRTPIWCDKEPVMGTLRKQGAHYKLKAPHQIGRAHV